MNQFRFSDNMMTFCVSEICNIKCIFCYHCEDKYDIPGQNQFIKQEDRRFMTLDTFKKVFDNLDYDFQEISMAGFGEPLLNPELPEIIKYFVDNNNKKVSRFFLPTNGTVLDEEYGERLLDILKDADFETQVLFSLNASNKEKYQELVGRGDLYEDTIRNIKSFIKKVKQKQLTHKVFTSVQSVVVKENSDDVRAFYNQWSEFFNKNDMVFKLERACSCGDTYVSEETPHTVAFIVAGLANQHSSNETFKQAMKDAQFDEIADEEIETTRLEVDYADLKDMNQRKTCSALWKHPFVRVDGRLSICSRDLLGKSVLGDLTRQSFTEIFFGEKYREIRRRQILGDFSEPNLCFDCNGFEASPIPEEKLKEYILRFEDEKLWRFYKKRKDEKVLFDKTYCCIKDNNTFLSFLEEINTEFLFTNYSDCIQDDRLLVFKKGAAPKELSDNKTYLPCYFLTSELYFEEDGVFCGCDKIKVDFNKYKDAIIQSFKGNNSKLPDTCINCIERKMPPAYIFYIHKDLLVSIWKEFYIERSVYERNLPDFNTTEFDKAFLKTNAAEFRESYIRFLYKYSDNEKKLIELSNILVDFDDPYLYLILLSLMIRKGLIEECSEIVKRIKNILPSDYVKKICEIYNKVSKNEKFEYSLLEKERFSKEDNIYKVLESIEYFSWQNKLF